jgi:GNAT superfamily N-acetyltransferase
VTHSPFTIRRVDISDPLVREAIKSLHAECFDACDNPYTPDNTGAWWVAYAGDEAAGFAGILPSYQWHATGYLCRSGVLPKFRGQGLQQRLIRIRIKYARQQGWTTVVSDTHKNPASANSLINCGFKLYQPRTPWGFITALYWRRNLSE